MKNGNLLEDKLIKREPNVLIIDLAKSYGGVEKRIEQIVIELHKNNLSYGLVVLKNTRLHKICESMNLNAFPLDLSRGNPIILFVIAYLTIKHKFQILDVHNVQSQFWGGLAALFTRKKIICTVHSSYGKIYKGSKKWFYEIVLKFNAFLGSQFIAVSSSVWETLSNIGVKSSRIALIYNGIDPQRRSSRKSDSQDIKFADKHFVIVSVGRLEPEKGHSNLLQAISLVTKTGSRHLKCYIVGNGSLKKNLTYLAKSLKIDKYIFFTGFVNDVEKYLRISDIFCLPSLSEGLPFALLEACCFETALLLTRVGDMGKLFRHGVHAYLTPPGDVEKLAKGILFLWDHKEKRLTMGKNAFSLVKKELSNIRMIEKTLSLYKELTA